MYNLDCLEETRMLKCFQESPAVACFLSFFFLRKFSSDFAVRYQLHPLDWTFARCGKKGPFENTCPDSAYTLRPGEQKPFTSKCERDQKHKFQPEYTCFSEAFLCVFGSLDVYRRHEFRIAVLMDGLRCVEELSK